VKDDKVLYSNPGLPGARRVFGDDVAVGQRSECVLRTNVQAMDRLAQNFARTIVTSILEAF
jgi:hypothetical protein